MSSTDHAIVRASAPTRYGDTDTDNLLNVPEVVAWLGDRSGTNHDLLQDNRKALQVLFGSPHQHVVREHRFWVWSLLFEGVPYWVLSAKSKGTCLEVQAGEIPWRRAGVDLRFAITLHDALRRVRPPVPSQRGSNA